MKDPTAVSVKPKTSELDWSEEGNDVKHLTSENFDSITKVLAISLKITEYSIFDVISLLFFN